MSIENKKKVEGVTGIQNAMHQSGIEFERDVPVPGQRRIRDWAKLIGIARKLELNEDNRVDALRVEMSALQSKNAELLAEVFHLKEIASAQVYSNAVTGLKDEMDRIDIAKDDQLRLLATMEPAKA